MTLITDKKIPNSKLRLGAYIVKDDTRFNLWAPDLEKINLVIYDGYYGEIKQEIKMIKTEETGIFSAKVQGNQHGMTYNYRIFKEGALPKIVVDPYAKSTTANGHRSIVIDHSQLHPEGWDEDNFIEKSDVPIVYEANIRDFTYSLTSGVKEGGIFNGFVEEGSQTPEGHSSGFDYLKSLGVTYVQLMPIFDFGSIDETDESRTNYNWGYDPQNYLTVEGSYASNPYDPMIRIMELKEMIQRLHQAGIGVVMDVVFNHVYDVEAHPFEQINPGYFFRQDENGNRDNASGVGNVTATEHTMMRKYMKDAIEYWSKHYHIDGFRFDLMGLHDKTTMTEVAQRASEINPNTILYGEGWTLPTMMDEKELSIQANGYDLAPVGFFNDGIRDLLRGKDFDWDEVGFIQDHTESGDELLNHLLASQDGPYHYPTQVIQYVESHDNYALFDRLMHNNDTNEEESLLEQDFATSILLTSQGIPFFHAGQEFMRTQQGIRDAYNNNMVNALDWSRADRYKENIEFFRNLIQLRKQEPLLHLKRYEKIREGLENVYITGQVVKYSLKNKHERLWFILNASDEEISLELPNVEMIKKIEDGKVFLDDETKIQIEGNYTVPRKKMALLKEVLSDD